MVPSSSSAENSLSVETTIYLFLKYYPVENRLEQTYFLKKEFRMSYVVFLYKSGLRRKSIEAGLFM